MRTQVAAVVEAEKPMIAFADPVFAKETRVAANAEQVALRSLSGFYRGSQLDVRSLAENLPQLPGTRVEVEAIAESLGVGKDDINLDSTRPKRRSSNPSSMIFGSSIPWPGCGGLGGVRQGQSRAGSGAYQPSTG